MTVRSRTDWPKGEVVRFAHQSQVLQDNIWADPSERDFCVYLPPGYSESADPYVALWDFAAFTNAGPGHLNWKNQGREPASATGQVNSLGEITTGGCADAGLLQLAGW